MEKRYKYCNGGSILLLVDRNRAGGVAVDAGSVGNRLDVGIGSFGFD